MPNESGSVIDDTIRESNSNSDSQSTHRNAVGIDEPEIIGGYSSESPDSVRFESSGGGDTVKRTKRGTVDRRTKAGRSGESGDAAGTKESVHLNRVSLDTLLFSLHLMGANMLSVPELKLDAKEAKDLSEAIAEVNKFYNIGFNPKHVAIANLMAVAGTIYGTRFFAWRLRTAMEKTAIPAKGPQAMPTKPSQASAVNGKAPDVSQHSPSSLFGSGDASL